MFYSNLVPFSFIAQATEAGGGDVSPEIVSEGSALPQKIPMKKKNRREIKVAK